MNADKLLLTFSKDGLKTRVNMCDNWQKIHDSLKRIGINRTLYSIYMNDADISITVGKCSNELLTNIANLISENEQLVTVHLICKFLQYGDQEFAEILPSQIDTYDSVLDIENDYRDFVDYKYRHMSDKEKINYKSNRLYRNYELVELYGKPVLFSEERIPSAELPSNIYRYDVRSDCEGKGIMVQLGKGIKIDHWGTILSNKPIRLDEDGYRDIYEDKDVVFPLCPYVTLEQYLNEYKNKTKEKTR